MLYRLYMCYLTVVLTSAQWYLCSYETLCLSVCVCVCVCVCMYACVECVCEYGCIVCYLLFNSLFYC